MPETFPITLPAALVSDHSYSEQDHFEANPVKVGPPRYELLTSTSPAYFPVAWIFSQAELEIFEDWYKASLLFGAKSFNLDLKVGAGYLPHECYFVKGSAPRRKLIGKKWRVSAALVAVELVYNP